MAKHKADDEIPLTVARFPIDPASSKKVTRIPVELALYERPVRLGSVNPRGEISYEGYRRVQTTAVNGRTPEVRFPARAGEFGSSLVTHVVVLLLDGTVVACVPVRPTYVNPTDIVRTDLDEALSGALLTSD